MTATVTVESTKTEGAHTSPRPAGVTWVSPYLTASDVEGVANFYVKAFGFEKHCMAPGEDGSIWHGEMKYKDQMIMMGKAGAYGGKTLSPNASGVESPMNLYLYCENVDEFYKHAVEAGAISLSAPADMFWGDRMCSLKDPEGYTWCFATCLGTGHKKDF